MDLVYLANVRLPTEKAHGIQIMKTCEALAKQGVTIDLVVPRRFNSLKGDPFEFYQIQKNFSLTRLFCLDLISLNVFGALGFWIESWTFFRSVQKYVQNKKSSLFYTRDLSIAYWLSKKNANVFYEIHSLPDKIDERHRAAWHRTKGIIVISNGLKEDLIRAGVSRQKIIVAHDAVDVNEFIVAESKEVCRTRLGLPLNKKIVVYTGHLYEWKGARVLAEAARQLPVDIQVYLVGGTKEDVARCRLEFTEPNLHFPGWQKHSEMVYWQKAADVLVLPTSAKTTMGGWHTSPLKLFEYMASGVPIIASDSPAMREVLNAKNAILVPPDSSFALKNAIIKSLQEPEKYANLAVKAREESLQFTWENRASLIFGFISQHGT